MSKSKRDNKLTMFHPDRRDNHYRSETHDFHKTPNFHKQTSTEALEKLACDKASGKACHCCSMHNKDHVKKNKCC